MVFETWIHLLLALVGLKGAPLMFDYRFLAKRDFGAVALLLVWLTIGSAFGQEIDPSGPFFLAAGVKRANLIVVGTFRVGWFYPSFDGWHYSGALHIEKVLDGSRKADPPIEFRWKEGYGATCLVCDRMSRISRQRGIWLLTQKDGQWRFSGTAATLCGWSLPMHVRGAVETAIRQKKAGDTVQ
jgi:hypothetical protein